MKQALATFFGIILLGYAAIAIVCVVLLGLTSVGYPSSGGLERPGPLLSVLLLTGFPSLLASKKCLGWNWSDLANFLPSDARKLFQWLGRLKLKSWQKSVALIALLFSAGLLWYLRP